ncbi:putative transcriptional regulatory protein C3C7.04 [Grifola frondosa]|uniref:Putative transcriptional regulatory protein C3C7.04 n=1 Tax=Grifola frondosa TaxID=5627 RepID=A0A1C7M5B2_GRIFR|nr:putative transcriptional regulatory protein C3C7.04 [Grifola frondosa]
MRTPGMLGQQGSGGLYAGPTSAASHLISPSDREDSDPSDHPTSSTDGASPTYPDKTGTSTASTTPAAATYDHDLIALLPPVHTIDGLIEYYFEYCNWIYRTVNEPALLAAWGRFKAGQCGDRIVFATVCVLIALSARYLPPGHALLASLPGTCEELGNKYYGLMHTALRRYRDEIESPGRRPEETWSVRGELVTIGTAMGLHRDPGKSRFEKSVAERRRWAWWHIVLLERWQAFMFGRPLSIASHHFNTQLPSYCDAALDQSGRLYLPNIALFRLAYVLGDIMDDAVSFRAVPYSSVQEKDAILMHWYDSLPPELDLDEYRIARSLASPITSVRRLGVQSVIIRTAYHHIRFTLHRPYAKVPESLETAVSAASQLIALVGQTRPDFLSNSALAVPGHMNWGPFHVFSAAMFFSFQLIMKPDQEAASLFRENIRKSMASLEQSRGSPEERERKKAQVLSLVRTLAFPYQDSPYSRSADSPSYQRLTDGFLTGGASPGIPGTRSMAVPDIPQLHGAPQGQPLSQSHTQMPVSSVRWTPSRSERPAAPPYVPPLKGPSVHAQQLPSHHHTPQISPTSSAASYNAGTYASQQAATMQQPLPQHAHFFREEQDVGYMLPADESSMWGASIGFGLSEWAQFVDVMQRPDNSRLGLMQGPAQYKGPGFGQVARYADRRTTDPGTSRLLYLVPRSTY